MKVNDELYVLELPLPVGDDVWIMNLSLIADADHGLTLVDTGLNGQEDLIEKAIVAEGLSLGDVKQIVLTHQDADHIGSLAALKEKTGATVYAYVDEIPYIEGKLRSAKYPSPERLAANPGLAEMLGGLKRTTVDRAIADGETLPFAAGAVAIATPGHTEGHMSLYLPNTKTLIVGDAMVSNSGILDGPMEMATPNMAQALESIKKFLNYDVETVLCYHGGLVTDDANGQLKRVAG